MPSNSSTLHVDGTAASSSTTLFPRLPLRTIYTLFIDAVRDRLIDDICIGQHRPLEANAPGAHFQVLGRPSAATRLGRGFLSNRDHTYPTWSCGWEQRSHNQFVFHTFKSAKLMLKFFCSFLYSFFVDLWCIHHLTSICRLQPFIFVPFRH